MKSWRNYLVVLSLGLVGFGMALAFFGQSDFFEWLYNREIRREIFGGQELPAQFRIYQDYIYGVLGSVVAGWGLLMAFVFHHHFLKRESWLRNASLAGLSCWFFPDTLISLLHGAQNNATVNLVLYLSLLLPFLLNWRKFGRKAPTKP